MEVLEPHIEETETGVPEQKIPWIGRVGPVLLSIIVSSVISAAAVSVGWKASVDTFNAVSEVKIQEHQERLDKLDAQTVKLSDLVYRDQLLDMKLSTLNLQISALKDQISELDAGRKGSR